MEIIREKKKKSNLKAYLSIGGGYLLLFGVLSVTTGFVSAATICVTGIAIALVLYGAQSVLFDR